MEIEWITKLEQNQIGQVHGLMQHEWWCQNRSLNDVTRVIETSDIVLAASNEDGKVIGFARVLTDYVYKALLFDVIVEPSYRQYGLGREIIEYLLNMEKLNQVKSFELYCPEQINGFYEKLGFVISDSNLLTLNR